MFEQYVEKTNTRKVKSDVIAKAEKQLAADKVIHTKQLALKKGNYREENKINPPRLHLFPGNLGNEDRPAKL